MDVKIVLDTSVFVSSLISASGPSRQLLRECFNGVYKPLMGNNLFYEYEALLQRPSILAKCPLSIPDRYLLLNSFLSICEWVQVHYLWRPNLKDEGDNHLIELAVAGGATVIATYNLRDFQNAELLFPDIRICRPEELLNRSKKWQH